MQRKGQEERQQGGTTWDAGSRDSTHNGQIDSLGTTNGEPVRSLVGLARGVVRLIRGAVGVGCLRSYSSREDVAQT